MADLAYALACGIGLVCGIVWAAVSASELTRGTYPPTAILISALGFTLALYTGVRVHG